MAQYVINTTRSFSREDSTMQTFFDADISKWVESSYAADGPLYCAALSLFVTDIKLWNKKRSVDCTKTKC